MSSYQELGLPSFILTTLKQVNIQKPSDVQENCIPVISSGRNVIARSPTGTGKTAAFALPIIAELSKDPYGIFCLVLSPTRELADQISSQFSMFGKGIGIDVCTVFGGLSDIKQLSHLGRRPHVVVATTGRLLDFLNRGGVAEYFDSLRFLVLDEVDQLIKGGFWGDVEEIVKILPKEPSY